MFTPAFSQVKNDAIVAQIQQNGYFCFEKAVTSDYIDRTLAEIDFNHYLVNENDIGVVFAQQQKYLTHCLAKSKLIYDLVTSERVLDICRTYFKSDRFRVKAQRLYQTLSGHQMQWHTDNKMPTDMGDVLQDIPGIIFIFYFCDTNQGAFQYVKDSHLKLAQTQVCDYSDDFIHTHYQDQVVTFRMPKGSLIIYNTHGIHRAEPYQAPTYTRTSLFFQIDENLDGEKLLLNAEFIDQPSEELFRFLGFGIASHQPSFPKTALASLNSESLMVLQNQLLGLLSVNSSDRFLLQDRLLKTYALEPEQILDLQKGLLQTYPLDRQRAWWLQQQLWKTYLKALIPSQSHFILNKILSILRLKPARR